MGAESTHSTAKLTTLPSLSRHQFAQIPAFECPSTRPAELHLNTTEAQDGLLTPRSTPPLLHLQYPRVLPSEWRGTAPHAFRRADNVASHGAYQLAICRSLLYPRHRHCCARGGLLLAFEPAA